MRQRKSKLSPYELGKEFFDRNLKTKPTRDIARHTKQLILGLRHIPLSEDPNFKKFIGNDTRPGDVTQHSKRLLRTRVVKSSKV
jgi:hypothetical protein